MGYSKQDEVCIAVEAEKHAQDALKAAVDDVGSASGLSTCLGKLLKMNEDIVAFAESVSKSAKADVTEIFFEYVRCASDSLNLCDTLKASTEAMGDYHDKIDRQLKLMDAIFAEADGPKRDQMARAFEGRNEEIAKGYERAPTCDDASEAIKTLQSKLNALLDKCQKVQSTIKGDVEKAQHRAFLCLIGAGVALAAMVAVIVVTAVPTCGGSIFAAGLTGVFIGGAVVSGITSLAIAAGGKQWKDVEHLLREDLKKVEDMRLGTLVMYNEVGKVKSSFSQATRMVKRVENAADEAGNATNFDWEGCRSTLVSKLAELKGSQVALEKAIVVYEHKVTEQAEIALRWLEKK